MDRAEFDAHHVWTTVASLKELLTQADDAVDASHGPILNQARFVLSEVLGHESPSETAPYAKAALDKVHNHLNSAVSELTNYVSNRNTGHLTNLSSHVDQALYILGLWPAASLLRGGAATQARRTFEEYKQAAEEALTRLRERNDELEQRLAAQVTEEQSWRQQTEIEVQSLHQTITQMQSKITADESRLDQLLTTTTTSFNEQQTERTNTFDEWLKTQAGALKTLAADDLAEVTRLKDEAQTTFDAIDALRNDTEKVSSLAVGEMTANKSKEYSDKQWRWGVGANLLGFVALAIGGAFVMWSLWSISADEDVSWQYIVLKLGVTLTIAAAAAVAFTLGSHLLSRSHAVKRLDLELRTIGPFLADVEDSAVVYAAKKDFLDRAFGRGWENHANTDVRDVDMLLNVVRTMAGIRGDSGQP